MTDTKNEADSGASRSDAGLADVVRAAYWQQGRLLMTQFTRHLPEEAKAAADHFEACRAFAFFTEDDSGRGRVLVAEFNSPEDCRVAVDEHNRLLREKAANAEVSRGAQAQAKTNDA